MSLFGQKDTVALVKFPWLLIRFPLIALSKRGEWNLKLSSWDTKYLYAVLISWACFVAALYILERALVVLRNYALKVSQPFGDCKFTALLEEVFLFQ